MLLAVGILGGGFEVKEVKISNVTSTGRILAGVVGVVFIGLGFWQPNAVIGSAPTAVPSPAPAAAPPVAATSPIPNEREGWHSAEFPPPNAGWLVFRFIGGNPACASYDGLNCLWGMHVDQIRFNQIRPLVCGADHREKYKETGYENPKHWCNLAKPNP